jgi:hypothetical protein
LSNSEFEKFYDNLVHKNYSECEKVIDNLPDNIKNIIANKEDFMDSLFKKTSEILSLLGDTAKTAFAHAKELADNDPVKAKYIFGLALAGMLMSYFYGRWTKR